MNREHAEAVAVIEAQMGEYVRIRVTRPNYYAIAYREGARMNSADIALISVKSKIGLKHSDKVTFVDRSTVLENWPGWGIEGRIHALSLAIEDFFDNVPF